jgi:hypothetical protein
MYEPLSARTRSGHCVLTVQRVRRLLKSYKEFSKRASTGSLRLTDRNIRAYRRELFEGNFEQLSQNKMGSYPTRATAVGMPAFRAFNRFKQIVLCRACRVKKRRT